MASSSSTTPDDREPLLQRSHSSSASISSYSSRSKTVYSDEEAPYRNSNLLDRSIENDVLPETNVLGRNLGWTSAYILIMSRVIGSGIFATPGAIVQSVGSVGITLLLWIAGALISWLSLAISLEYGCMLPRSGGKQHCAICYSEHKLILMIHQGRKFTWSSLIDTHDFWPLL